MDPTDATSAARFLPLSCEIAARLGPGPIRHVATTGSTNADLVDEARRGDVDGAVLVADHQTSGRGRLDRTWDDAVGESLLVSLRIPAGQSDATAAMQALGAAARSAADGACRDRVLAKWPNDLVVADGPAPGKLAGVLAQFVPGHRPSVVIGIGINLRPIRRQEGSTSIVECGGIGDRDALLADLLGEFSPRLADGSRVLDELREHSATIGSRVRVELPGGRELVGEAVGLAAGGELMVRADDDSDHVVASGDVVHLRPG